MTIYQQNGARVASRNWFIATIAAVMLGTSATAASDDSQSHPMRFDRLSLDDGLSQSTVISILQDSRGLMWFGTENGLNSYNGYEFEQYLRERGNPQALSNDFIYDVEEDSDGNLWIATNGGGLARMDRKTRKFESFRHDAGNPNSVSDNIIRTLLIDAEGIIWLGTRGAGLDRFDPQENQFTHYRFNADDQQEQGANVIHKLYMDSSNALWVGSNQGLGRLDLESQEFVYYKNNPDDAATLSDERIRSILEDSSGQLWVGTYGGGLNRFNKETGGFDHFRNDADDSSSISNDRVTALYEDSDQRLWVGTSRGLNLMDRERGTFTHHTHDQSDSGSIGGDSITTLYQDRGGMLWIGTLARGVSKWNPRTWSYGLEDTRPLTSNGKSHPTVLAFAEDKAGILWVGTFGDGLNGMNRDDGSVTKFRHDPSSADSISDDRVMSLMIDEQGLLWVGTMTGGINVLDLDKGTNEKFRHDPADPLSLSADGIMTMYQDSNSLVWVGTFGGGISRFDPTTRQFTRFQADPEDPNALSSNRVTTIAEDASGKMWIGTDAGGLNLFDPKTENFHHFRYNPDDPTGLAEDTVYSLNVAADGTVWVGTRGGGLDKVTGDVNDPAGIRFSNLSQRDGLANDVIYGIEIDDSGELWLSTNYGISRLDPESGNIRNIHRSDGLQSEEFTFGAHYRNADGELFFGGSNGFNAFRPESVLANEQIPLIMLTGFFTVGQPIKSDVPVDEQEGVELSYSDNSVSFEFAATDYAAPTNNQYMYKLEGFDKDWIDLGNRRRVTYTDLDDGQYLLRVKAANSSGVWNEAGFAMPVRVTPAPWETWWAYMGYLAMVVQFVVFLWLGHKRKIRREKEYSNRLEMQVEQRTAEVLERNLKLKSLNKSLQESSLSDPLTGLRNRRFVFEEISKELGIVQRRHQEAQRGLDPRDASDLVFMMIDLDNFKPINDTYGHAAGDQILLEIRDLLLGTCRKSDFVIRWGGDEFVVIAKQSSPGEVEALAERIRSTIAEHTFSMDGGQIVRTTCSIGFAAYPIFSSPRDEDSLDQIINLADNLMYEAKKQRNAWAGMLGVSQAATSENFELRGIEATSLLFRAHRDGNLRVCRSGGDRRVLLDDSIAAG
ncbi:MAG: diguanylate cyclase [Gammaproteobacteria bacterium]|nr:diguanylate cyclase [Gammaproteobacteria bacterium]MDH3416205.1 diguanylate cyclase [Gammaproteobacteria bacterium]